MRRRQRRMRGNLPGPEGLAGREASAALHGLPVVPPRAAPRALHPLPLPANAAHAEYSDRLLGGGPWIADVDLDLYAIRIMREQLPEHGAGNVVDGEFGALRDESRFDGLEIGAIEGDVVHRARTRCPS